MNFAKALLAGIGALALAACAAPSTRPANPAAAAAETPAPPAAASQPYADAVKLLQANQMQEAEAALLALASANPKASGPQTNLGILYARSNRKAEARAAFARAIAANPANAIAHNGLGVLAREAGDYEQAERAYRAAIAADAALAAARLNLAILYDVYLKRPVDALAAYRAYEAMTGHKDLRALVWIAELEARTGTAPSAPAPAQVTQPGTNLSGETQS